MTHEALARRRPLWDAMSDLFLDTEVRWHVPRVARRCVESGYDDETLERIFWAEVFPEAIPNMLQVAGDWIALALDEGALIKRANSGSIPWLTRRAHGRMVQDEWLAVREVTAWLRPLEEPAREVHVRALDLLGRRYFETPGTTSVVATKERVAEVLDVARREWARYEAVCQRMRGEGEPPHDACAAEVRSLLALHSPAP